MDACPGGDLSPFALTSEKLTPEQVKFVGLEVTSVLAHLHIQHVLYRDLKPENLLLDARGHVRLIDFGLALAGTDNLPLSDELCGTPCYMAPEVRYAGKKGVKKYSGAADWYTLGVLLYELTEQNLPFGEEPQFRDHKAEWRKPKCMGNNNGGPGGKSARKSKKSKDGDDSIESLIKGLLEWKADKRLGGGKSVTVQSAISQIKGHGYWGSPEWALIDLARLPSPLKAYVDSVAHKSPNEGKLKKQQRAAIDTALKMASADAKSKMAHENERDTASELMRSKEKQLEVMSWDYVSPHAIEMEYVETIASSVSLL